MRANIARGKLRTPPSSYTYAVGRLQQIKLHAQRIQDQLDDPKRALQENYDVWRLTATQALKIFRCEEHELELWIAKNEPNLFKQAYELLKDLEVESILHLVQKSRL